MKSILMLAARVGGAAVCDCLVVLISGTILWNNGGVLVTTGPLPGILLSMIVAAALLAGRTALIRDARGGARTSAGRRRELGVLAVDTVLVGGSVLAWHLLDSYYLGWLACFGSLLFTVAGLLQLLTDVVLGSNRGQGLPHQNRSRYRSLEALRVIGVVLGAIGFAMAQDVHQWNVQVISPLILLLAASLGIATFVGFLFRRSHSRVRS